MSKQLTDVELLERLVSPDYIARLTAEQANAFRGMLRSDWDLTTKQSKWVRGVAERLGIQTAPSENLFSNMDPEKRARQLAAASKVKLPWEK